LYARRTSGTACAIGARTQAGYWRSSEQLFRHAVTVSPGNPICLLNLGQSLLDQGRDREALACLLDAQRRWPGWDLPDRGLGLVYGKLGERGKALQALARGLAISPEDTDMLHQAAWDLVQEGRLEEAVLLLRRYLALEPRRLALCPEPAMAEAQSGEARMLLAQCCRKLGWHKEACRVLEVSRGKAPDDANVLLNLGLALGEAGRPEEALEPLRRCGELQPAWPEPHTGLAGILERLGRGQEARAERSKAAALAPVRTAPPAQAG